MALDDLLLDLLEAKVVFARPLVKRAEDELDLLLKLRYDGVLKRVYSSVRLLELLAKAPEPGLNVGALDHEVDDLLEFSRRIIDAGAHPGDPISPGEFRLDRCRGLADDRDGNTHDVGTEDVNQYLAFSGEPDRLQYHLSLDRFRQRQHQLSVRRGALQAQR